MDYIKIIIIAAVVAVAFGLERYFHSAGYRGAKGERDVATILSRLPKEYKVLNDIILPTQYGTTQIDHIVLSPYGIFVIETKNYSGWIFGNGSSEKWKQTLFKESHYFHNPVKQNWGHIYALSDLLELPKKVFIPIVVFSDASELKVDSYAVPVIHMKLLRNVMDMHRSKCLSPQEVEHYQKLILEYQMIDSHAAKKHVEDLNVRMAFQKSELEQGLCPKCDGRLVLRNGKYGQFYGCSNYPKCKYTVRAK